MTEQESISCIKSIKKEYEKKKFGTEALDMGINALEEVEKLRKENRALKNRCHAITHGTMCFFCPMDCGNRKEKYRGSRDDC